MRQPSGVLQKAKQPFESQPLHPEGRALFSTGQVIDGSADTQCQAASNAAFAKLVRNDFLLWRPYRQKAESEWTGRFDVSETGFDGGRVLNEI